MEITKGIMIFHKDTPDWRGSSRRLKQAQARLLFLRHRCLSLPYAAFRTAVIVIHEAPPSSSRLWFPDTSLWRGLPYGLKKHTIGQPSYSIVTDWQSVMIDAGALWVESRWMPAVNGLAASPPAQHTAPGIQQPRTTPPPTSPPRSPDLILPAQFSRFNPPGIITLLFSCVVTIWLTGYCILRKILSAGKKAHSEWNPPHLKYQLIDKVLIFKYMQLN